MMYHVQYSNKAAKQLKKLDKVTAKMIFSWIDKNLEGCDNPRSKGRALKGNHSGEWRYRVGDYRIICDIRDEELVILALNIGHRSTVY
ncbi:MAG: type II toxin-antitoxin system RelE/ParE family toxin [Erysipelotrichaceae bacterium]|nr:type II toxin-antitoxin system RelE/ParE family toxin [Erysipelotrichaceae bacterium]